MEGGLLTAIDILTRVHTFSSEEIFSILLIMIRISESDLSDGGSSSTVVDDFFHDTFNISFSFRIIKVSKLGFGHTEMTVGFKNTFLVTSSLTSNNSTHFSKI